MRLGFFSIIVILSITSIFLILTKFEREISYENSFELTKKALEEEFIKPEIKKIKEEEFIFQTFFPVYLTSKDEKKALFYSSEEDKIKFITAQNEEIPGTRFFLVPALSKDYKDCYSIQILGSRKKYLVTMGNVLMAENFTFDQSYFERATFCFNHQKKTSSSNQLLITLNNLKGEALDEKDQEGILGFNKEALSLFRLVKMTKGLENLRFAYQEPNGKINYFVYNVELGKFLKEKIGLEDSKFYQPIQLSLRYLTKQGTLAFNQPKHSALRLSVKDHHLTTDLKDSNEFYFVPTLPLDKNQDKCLSFAVYEKEGFYLSILDNRLYSLEYNDSDFFRKNSTFCLERTLKGSYRIESSIEKKFWDLHTKEDGFVSLISENSYEPIESTFDFIDNKTSLKNSFYKIYEPGNKNFVTYGFDEEKKFFTRQSSDENKKEFLVPLEGAFNYTPFVRYVCEISNRKQKSFYKINETELGNYLMFLKDYEDSHFFDKLSCQFFGENSQILSINCESFGKSISIYEECSAELTIEKTYYYQKGKWSQLDLVALFSSKE